jgi:hypothetical protein
MKQIEGRLFLSISPVRWSVRVYQAISGHMESDALNALISVVNFKYRRPTWTVREAFTKSMVHPPTTVLDHGVLVQRANGREETPSIPECAPHASDALISPSSSPRTPPPPIYANTVKICRNPTIAPSTPPKAIS